MSNNPIRYIILRRDRDNRYSDDYYYEQSVLSTIPDNLWRTANSAEEFLEVNRAVERYNGIQKKFQVDVVEAVDNDTLAEFLADYKTFLQEVEKRSQKLLKEREERKKLEEAKKTEQQLERKRKQLEKLQRELENYEEQKNKQSDLGLKDTGKSLSDSL